MLDVILRGYCPAEKTMRPWMGRSPDGGQDMCRTLLARAAASVVAALASAVTLVMPLSPASAEGMSWVDGRADMWRVPARELTPSQPAPAQTNGDIRSVSVRHSARAVIVRASFTDLRRGRFDLDVSGGIETNEGVFRGFNLGWNDRQGGYAWLENAAQDRVRCAWTHRLNFTENTVLLRIPRECLSRPRWVRVHLNTMRVTDSKRNTMLYSDDAHSGHTGAEGKWLWTRRLHRA